MSLEIESNNRVGAPEGNQNAKKGKIFADEIRKFLNQNPQKKREIVEGLVEAAVAREPWAVKELIDRMDGKAVQATEISGPEGTELVKGIGFMFIDGDVKPD